jgi:hypothetical protein
MKSTRAKELLESIDDTIKNINGFSNISDLEKAYLARYLVVFISGIYEEAIETIINENVEKLNSKRISMYIATSLEDNFQNPNIYKISNLLNKFEDNLGELFKKQMSDKAKVALGSIVANKNAIAHGDATNITLNVVIQYYQDSRIIIEKVDDIFL